MIELAKSTECSLIHHMQLCTQGLREWLYICEILGVLVKVYQSVNLYMLQAASCLYHVTLYMDFNCIQ